MAYHNRGPRIKRNMLFSITATGSKSTIWRFDQDICDTSVGSRWHLQNLTHTSEGMTLLSRPFPGTCKWEDWQIGLQGTPKGNSVLKQGRHDTVYVNDGKLHEEAQIDGHKDCDWWDQGRSLSPAGGSVPGHSTWVRYHLVIGTVNDHELWHCLRETGHKWIRLECYGIRQSETKG